MLNSLVRSRFVAIAATLALTAATTAAVVAQSVSVTLNGSPVNLDPAPQERAGRVFVPLRGIFERLGASVVYANGTINAQGNGRSVSLHIGSTQATVNGQPASLDVAPFIIGASTYVPLRFVSQALGASVNYDGTNRIVALSNGGSGGPPPQQNNPQPQPQQQQSQEQLRDVRPGRDATVSARRPSIEARFTAPVDPNTVRVFLDDLNVTDSSTRSPNGIVYSPDSDLQSTRHTVRVVGTDQQGARFERSWSFTSGTAAAVNEIRDLRPGDGAQVGQHFVVSGRSLPGARILVEVGTVSQQSANDVLGQVFGINSNGGQNTFRTEVVADGNGSFSASVDINARPGQRLALIVDSTDTQSQSAAPRVRRTLIVQ